jgi:hypothetical protein
MAGDDIDYFERRAEAEIALAQRADHARAVQAHYQLATFYLDRIHGDGPENPPQV